MMAREPIGVYPRNSAPRFDLAGLVALSVTPALALYQGVVTALGILPPFDATTATLIPLAAILACLVLRLTGLARILASPAIRRASLFLLAYLLVVLASTLIVFIDPLERDPAKMFQQYLSTVPAVLIFFVMVTGPGGSAGLRTLNVSLLVWAVAAVITPLTALTPLPIGEVQGSFAGSRGLRSFGVLGDGGTFVVSFLVVAFLATRRPVWFTLSLFALILSGSRMALVVAGAGVALYLVLANPRGRLQRTGERALRVVVASAVMIAALIALQVVFSLIAKQFGAFDALTRLSETQLGETDRLFSITQGLEWVKMSPVYGHGFNSYYYFSLRSAMFGANESNALNQIVQTLMDGGVLGLGFLALFFFEVIRPGSGTLIDPRNDPFAIRAWLLAFVVINQAAVYIFPAFFLTVLVFGLAGVVLSQREATRLTVPSGPTSLRGRENRPA